MIPMLFPRNAVDFNSGCIGFLSEATYCVAIEERNGIYECELKYPVEGPLFSEIYEDRIILAKPNETSQPQPFRIYKSLKPIDGVVTYLCEHISYQQSSLPIESVTIINQTANTALNSVFNASLLPHPFTTWSNITTQKSTKLSLVSVRAALGGVKGSLLDIYGGEYEFDRLNVKLHEQRGQDKGVIIAYGKNLIDLQQEKSISQVYTALFPFAKYTPEGSDDEITVMLPERIIYSAYADAYAYKRVLIYDFSQEFENQTITVEALRSKAESYMLYSGIDKPQVSLTVEFEQLWQQPEYAQYELLERVSLCDTVSVYFEKLGITATAKVIRTEYDSIAEKYIRIEIGDARSSMADTINNTVDTVQTVKESIKESAKDTKSTMEKAIINAVKTATELITGQSGGYVVLNPSENPQEILILDTPDIETAVNVWRFNSGGLGHSSHGYNGPFDKIALTMDGQIVADAITSGVLRSILVEAVEINCNDNFHVTPDGVLAAIAGIIGGWKISEQGLTARDTADTPAPTELIQVGIEEDIINGGWYYRQRTGYDRKTVVFDLTLYRGYTITYSGIYDKAILTNEYPPSYLESGAGVPIVVFVDHNLDNSISDTNEWGYLVIDTDDYTFDINIVGGEPTADTVGMLSAGTEKGYAGISDGIVPKPYGKSRIRVHAGKLQEENTPGYITESGFLQMENIFVRKNILSINKQGARSVRLNDGKLKAESANRRIEYTDLGVEVYEKYPNGTERYAGRVSIDETGVSAGDLPLSADKITAFKDFIAPNLPRLIEPAAGGGTDITVYQLFVDSNGRMYRMTNGVTKRIPI